MRQSVLCAKSYFKYGRALFMKAQADNGALGPEMQQANAAAAADGAEGAEAPATAPAQQVANSGAADPKGKGKAAEQGDGGGDDAADEGAEGAEGEADDGGDMQLAWEMYEVRRTAMRNARALDRARDRCPRDALCFADIRRVDCQVARTLYERADDGELPQRDELLADVYMALGEHSLERAEFEACLKDYSTALRLYEQATPRADQLIVAQAHFRMALALQWVQKHTHAIEQCGMARALLEGALREASAAGAKEEAADFAAVLKDVMLKEEDIKLEAAIMAANPAAVVGAEAPQGGAGGSSGFDAPKLTGATNPSTSATAPVVVQNLGVVGRGTKKITLQPQGGAAAAVTAPVSAPAAAAAPKRAAEPAEPAPAAAAKKAKVDDVPADKPPECAQQ